jgi:hypothetical protein
MTDLSLEESETLLQRIDADQATLVAQRQVFVQRLEAAQQEAQEKFFEGDRPAVIAQLATARAEAGAALDLVESALSNLAGRRIEAERMRDHARVVDLRQQAAERRAEIQRLHAKALPWLRKISDLLQIELGPEVVSAARSSTGNFAFTGATPAELCSPAEAMPLNPEGATQYQRPLTRRLFDEAITLDAKAHELETELAMASVCPVASRAIGNGLRADLIADAVAAQEAPRLIQPGSTGDIFTDSAARIDAARKRNTQ